MSDIMKRVIFKRTCGSFQLLSVPRSLPCATTLHILILSGKRLSPRSADTWKITVEHPTTTPIPGQSGTCPDPTGYRNCKAARDRVLIKSNRTLELSLCYSSLWPNPAQRKLVSQKCWHTQNHRWVLHYCSNSWPKWDLPRCHRTLELQGS